MLHNQTYNLDQVAFAAVGLKDAQQTVMSLNLSSSKFVHVPPMFIRSGFSFLFSQMNAMNAANEELKGMMKTAKIVEIDVCVATRLVLPTFSEFFISISDHCEKIHKVLDEHCCHPSIALSTFRFCHIHFWFIVKSFLKC